MRWVMTSMGFFTAVPLPLLQLVGVLRVKDEHSGTGVLCHIIQRTICLMLFTGTVCTMAQAVRECCRRRSFTLAPWLLGWCIAGPLYVTWNLLLTCVSLTRIFLGFTS